MVATPEHDAMTEFDLIVGLYIPSESNIQLQFPF
jgi:hypothetical protein